MKLILLFTMLLTATAQAAETGTTIKSDSVRGAPFSDAKIITTLPAATKVEIIKKDGGWYQIKSAQGSGWIRMLSLRNARTSKSGNLSGLAALASGRSGTGKVVSTTGIRGLNEEELKSAHYDEKQIARLDSSASSRREAQKFAGKAKLNARQIDYLPEPGASK